MCIRPKGCYAVGKRVEAHSASRVEAGQAGPSARRAGRGWTHVRTGPRNTAIGRDWRVIHATLLANAHHKRQTPLKDQAGKPQNTRKMQKRRQLLRAVASHSAAFDYFPAVNRSRACAIGIAPVVRSKARPAVAGRAITSAMTRATSSRGISPFGSDAPMAT